MRRWWRASGCRRRTDSTLWVRFKVRNPDGNLLYVRYENTGTGAVAYTDYRLTKKGDVKLDLTGLDAGSWYRVDLDFVDSFDSSRKQSRWYGTARAGETPLKSPYRADALDAQVFQGGRWRDAPDNELYVRMGETGRYRVRLKPCGGIHDVIVNRIQAPAGRLGAEPDGRGPVGDDQSELRERIRRLEKGRARQPRHDGPDLRHDQLPGPGERPHPPLCGHAERLGRRLR